MNTLVAKEENGKMYNSEGDQLVICKNGCGRKTTMLGTGLCDFCWEDQRRLDNKKILEARIRIELKRGLND